MPSRIIRESCRTSETLDRLSDGAERLFWRLTTVADDFGRFEADARIVRANSFPLRTDQIKLATVVKWMRELSDSGAIAFYEVKGKPYAYFVSWGKHQRIRNSVSKFPDPPNGGGQFETIFEQRAIPVELRKQVRERDRVCLACGYGEELVFDHIIPVSKGGKATPENLQLLCYDCNAIKYTQTLNFLTPGPSEQEFMQHRRNMQQPDASCGELQRNAPGGIGYGVVGKGYGIENESGAPDFVRFWERYPRKIDKADARKSWHNLQPDATLVRQILSALDTQRRCRQWQEDGGKYIPHPSTWLKKRRWEDELAPSAGVPTSHKGLQAIQQVDAEMQQRSQDADVGVVS